MLLVCANIVFFLRLITSAPKTGFLPVHHSCLRRNDDEHKNLKFLCLFQ